MGFEPTTLRDLVGCSNHLSYWRLYGEQGPIWLCSRVMRFQSRPTNWPLLTIESPVAQVVRASDQITEGRGFKSHPRLGYFSESSSNYYHVVFDSYLMDKIVNKLAMVKV